MKLAWFSDFPWPLALILLLVKASDLGRPVPKWLSPANCRVDSRCTVAKPCATLKRSGTSVSFPLLQNGGQAGANRSEQHSLFAVWYPGKIPTLYQILSGDHQSCPKNGRVPSAALDKHVKLEWINYFAIFRSHQLGAQRVSSCLNFVKYSYPAWLILKTDQWLTARHRWHLHYVAINSKLQLLGVVIVKCRLQTKPDPGDWIHGVT